MGPWLYPISSKSGYYFKNAQGKRVKVSYESFRDFVHTEKVRDRWWGVHFNFQKVEKGDDLFIYTGDEDRGIIACAKIVGKDQNTRQLIIRIDKARTKKLLADPVPAPLVRRFIPYPRAAAIDLGPSLKDLKKLLPWRPEYQAKSRPVLSKLHLKPIIKTFANIKGGRQRRLLKHDAVLGQVKAYLKANGFEVGTRSFGNLRVDVAAVRKADLVIVEGKIIKKGAGRLEAREGLGQLLEYSWLFREENHKTPRKHNLWLACSARPRHGVVRFLTSQDILVSWPSKYGLSFSQHPCFVAKNQK